MSQNFMYPKVTFTNINLTKMIIGHKISS